MRNELCHICGRETGFLFQGLVLHKYQVSYFRCPECEYIQTEKPYWLDEAYGSAITDSDVGLVSRNIYYSGLVEKILVNNFKYKSRFLDYAGGYGLFVRLMRDRGFNFIREDKYCENIFAQNHDIENLNEPGNFELLTAFEVFEHFENPVEDVKKLLKLTETILFSTELQPNKELNNIDEWWYFAPESGQHISFYSMKTLEYIAKELHLYIYSNNNLHLLSKKYFKNNPLLNLCSSGAERQIDLTSLTQADFEFARNILKKTKEIGRWNRKGEDSKEDVIFKLSVAFASLDSTTIDLNSTKAVLDSTTIDLNSTKAVLCSKIGELNSIYSSREWRTLLFIQKMVKMIIPKGGVRRKIVVSVWRACKWFCKEINDLKQKMKSAVLLMSRYFIHFKQRKPRNINKQSKKIVYIGHSYHDKTKSTVFLIDYLKEFYDVEVVLDESWNGKPYPDLSFIDESYLGVIFFQNLPGKHVLNSINNDNIIFFPMYDGVPHDFAFWSRQYDLKVINFSKTLHERLAKWGFDSMYIQYFPDARDFLPGNANEVFFWQRLTRLNIGVVSKLLGSADMRIHLHKTIDPGQCFQSPTERQEKKYRITYSDWFETREEMQDVIKEKGIYIAPREFEGIGMSFLEAMSMGKAVVAVNNPTMNEYITHGENGYLFDLKKPKVIDFSNIETVQKNAHAFMKEGRARWERDKRRIIDFIEKE